MSNLFQDRLDELSKKTLNSYAVKAADDATKLSKRVVVGGTPEERNAQYDKIDDKIDKRLDGAYKAVVKAKAKNESEEMTEAEEQQNFSNAMNKIHPAKRLLARKAYNKARSSGQTHAAALSSMHTMFSEEVLQETHLNVGDSVWVKHPTDKSKTLTGKVSKVGRTGYSVKHKDGTEASYPHKDVSGEYPHKNPYGRNESFELDEAKKDEWIVSHKGGTHKEPVETFATGHTLDDAHKDAQARHPAFKGVPKHKLIFQKGNKIVTEESELEEETIHVGYRNSKGVWIKTSTHNNYRDAMKASGELEKSGKKGVQHRYDYNGSIDPGMRKLAHESVELDEKTLTDAELKKREEVAKAMEKDQPGIEKSKKYAIATAVAKRVA